MYNKISIRKNCKIKLIEKCFHTETRAKTLKVLIIQELVKKIRR